jgi:hypothetical protein
MFHCMCLWFRHQVLQIFSTGVVILLCPFFLYMVLNDILSVASFDLTCLCLLSCGWYWIFQGVLYLNHVNCRRHLESISVIKIYALSVIIILTISSLILWNKRLVLFLSANHSSHQELSFSFLVYYFLRTNIWWLHCSGFVAWQIVICKSNYHWDHHAHIQFCCTVWT